MFSYVPIVVEEGQRDSQERQQEENGEEVFGAPGSRQLQEVEEKDRGGNDSRLAHLNAIDPSQNVDGVGTKHGQHAHVEIVK